MSLLDGQLGKASLWDSFSERYLEVNRLFRIALTVVATSVLLTPFVIGWNFAYFTAKVAPWWLDVITGLNILAFLLGGFILGALGIAKLMANRQN
jgi:hypothetical protein